MKMTVKWNAKFERDLARQIERSLSKVTIPIEFAEMNVESLDDDCRRILLCLDEKCISPRGYIDYLDMAQRLGMEDNSISLAYDRLEQLGHVDLNKPLSGPKSARIVRDGRIAADNLRKLPEKQRQQEAVDAKQRRRRRWSFYYEKLVLPIFVAVVISLIVWVVSSALRPDSPQQPDNLNSENVEGSP